MKIINVSQATETEAWLDERVGRITGTKSAGLALEHYAQTDVQKLVEYRDKALEQAKKAKTPDKANEYYAKAQSYDEKIVDAEANRPATWRNPSATSEVCLETPRRTLPDRRPVSRESVRKGRQG